MPLKLQIGTRPISSKDRVNQSEENKEATIMIICVLISGLLTFIRQQAENIATNIAPIEITNSSVITSSKTQQSGNKTPRRSQSRMTYINEIKHFSCQTLNLTSQKTVTVKQITCPYFVTVCNCLLSSDLSVYVTIPASGDGDLLSLVSRFSSSNETQHSFLIKLNSVAVTVLV